MTHPTTNWRKALKDFAADYLVPVAGMFVLVLVGLGILGVTGWVLRWIALQVTPRVNNAGYIVMDIVQTIDDLGGTVQQAGFTQPIINTRVARTSVMVKDGQTVVIGGFMRDRLQKVETGIPILKDLPLLGPLFRRTEKTKDRTELMVFLTPRIVRTPDELRRLLEEERKRSRYAPPLSEQPPTQQH